jgi:hypothetical protein
MKLPTEVCNDVGSKPCQFKFCNSGIENFKKALIFIFVSISLLFTFILKAHSCVVDVDYTGSVVEDRCIRIPERRPG